MVAATNSNRGKVLIVEDEYLVSLSVAALLEDIGFDIVGPAARVEEGLKLVAAHELALAVLDMNLAGTMSWPIARALCEAGVPSFFLSGYPQSHALVPVDLSHLPICQKPFREEEIVSLIDQLATTTSVAQPRSSP